MNSYECELNFTFKIITCDQNLCFYLFYDSRKGEQKLACVHGTVSHNALRPPVTTSGTLELSSTQRLCAAMTLAFMTHVMMTATIALRPPSPLASRSHYHVCNKCYYFLNRSKRALEFTISISSYHVSYMSFKHEQIFLYAIQISNTNFCKNNVIDQVSALLS